MKAAVVFLFAIFADGTVEITERFEAPSLELAYESCRIYKSLAQITWAKDGVIFMTCQPEVRK